MATKHALGVLLFKKQTDGLFYARRFRRTDAVPAGPAAFETEVQITQNFSFNLEMLATGAGKLSIEDSGWADPYDSEIDLQLGADVIFTNNTPGLPNWPAAGGTAARRVTFSFSMAGGLGSLNWSSAGGSSGTKPFMAPPPGNHPYGLLLTLGCGVGHRARLNLTGHNPWGANPTVDHP